VKESLLFLTSQLSPGDCMGLVSYDEEVTTEIPLTFLDDAGKVCVLSLVVCRVCRACRASCVVSC
jgi:hypothetical protein